MFETEEFKKRLRDAIQTEAALNGLPKYEETAVDYLQRLAIENERALMDLELKKATGIRGIREAVQSAIILAKEGSGYASAQKRDTLTLSDIQTAYRVKFCQVWPFCK